MGEGFPWLLLGLSGIPVGLGAVTLLRAIRVERRG